MMPIPPLKEVQTRVQCPMGAGELAFRNMILIISYARPFIFIKVTSSKIIRSVTIVSIDEGN